MTCEMTPGTSDSSIAGTLMMLQHNRIALALHRLGDGLPTEEPTGRLLLLHGLGETTTSTTLPALAAAHWSGPIFGLDFSGHGASGRSVGGGYSSEDLMADVDVALAHLGPCTIVGRGLGAYVGLLIAGARPTLVRGALLTDGPGLAGGPTRPTSLSIPVAAPPTAPEHPDPWVLLELSSDLRPADYAVAILRQAIMLSGFDTPIAVAARSLPPWLNAVANDPSVLRTDFAGGLAAIRQSLRSAR